MSSIYIKSISYNIKKDDVLYSELYNKYATLAEQFNKDIEALNAEAEGVRLSFIEKRNENRSKMQWEYELKHSITTEGVKLYHITAKCSSPLIGDEEFCKDRNYIPFQVVNNVFVPNGGGYVHNLPTASILTAEEVIALENKTVPERLRSKHK